MEQRRSQRFRIELPVEVTQLSGKRVNRPVKVFDIGSGGISFRSSREWDVGGRIEYVITLSAEKKVRIRCLGKIVRVENTPGDPEASYKVAATIERYEFLRSDKNG
ncbi:MAG: PilZ domain-containing protein [Bryobacteraceae bacterium]